ncbi:hypothetical protein V8C42DRAFT_224152 [Trichoderma barbatum]
MALRIHAVSASILLQIQHGNVRPSSFSDAAMVVALRQEIFVANMTERAVEPIATYFNSNWSLEPATDATWTHRIIVHAALVTNFAYGSDTKDVSQWDRLWQYVHNWEQRKPNSFLPMYYAYKKELWTFKPGGQKISIGGRGSTTCILPTIHYTYDCPIAGQQYLQLCRILLLAHDPRMPFLGMGRAQYLRNREEETRDAVRIICGISISNTEYMPARLTAGLSVAMCGELFTDPAETKELLRIVSDAELHLGWPSLKVSNRLRAFWGLHDFHL